MPYLLDTVTIVRHFTDTGYIGIKAREILNDFDNHFLISVISLMEIMYLSEKHRININLTETLNKIESSSLYSGIDLTPEILKVAERTPFGELHDRLILSTAKWLEIPIISSDEGFDEVEGIEVIWN
ncbi:type II toxin-antitoxin system VapC family toxin [Candidatus Poribacteria bacterium]|nr:type II toxin-antitoxin system VapC family toxin [Candidatus Poribacteria bacterium]